MRPHVEALEDRTAPALVAAFSFDENSGTSVTDLSNNGNSGTITNATWTATGKYGSALSFNGNARVDIADSALLHLTTGMTLEAWVNPAAITSLWQDVLYKGTDTYYLEATSPWGGVPTAGAKVNNSDVQTRAPATLAANTWTHLAATYDGSFLQLYVNGVLVSSTARTGSLPSSTAPLQIGGDTFSSSGEYFHGLIDEVRVYNVALTAAQIQADMSAPLT